MSSSSAEPNDTPIYLIETILVTTRKQRLAQFHHPDTGERLQHGLGRTGQPIRPYLGHRSSHSIHAELNDPGYYIELPDDLTRVEICHVTYDSSDRRHTTLIPWSEVNAPDLPSDLPMPKKRHKRPAQRRFISR